MLPTDHLLDVGSGLGAPARWLSTRFGCRITGIDLTPEFRAIAEHFTHLIGLDARVRLRVGNALAMPFDDGTFDGAYSMFVSMNIADKARLYREIYRVAEVGRVARAIGDCAGRGWRRHVSHAMRGGGGGELPLRGRRYARRVAKRRFRSRAGEERSPGCARFRGAVTGQWSSAAKSRPIGPTR